MARLDISRLRKNRSIYLKIGFLSAILFTVYAFNIEVDPIEVRTDYKVDDTEMDIINIPPTVQPEKKPLPPPPKVEVVEPLAAIDEPTFEVDPIEPLIETKTESKLTKEEPPMPAPKPVVKVAPPAPPVAPPAPKVEEGPIFFAEVMPRFPGCEDLSMDKREKKLCSEKAMMAFIRKHIKFPEMAREVGVHGTTVVEFTVAKDGSLKDFNILKDIGGGCGREGMRVVKKMPTWIPGMQGGRRVAVRYRLPIKFALLN